MNINKKTAEIHRKINSREGQAQAKPDREPRMDPKQALQILDALNQQEKQEQRKQALKVQRAGTKGKDW